MFDWFCKTLILNLEKIDRILGNCEFFDKYSRHFQSVVNFELRRWNLAYVQVKQCLVFVSYDVYNGTLERKIN